MTRQPSLRLQRGVALALALLAAPLFSCFAPQSVTCQSGLVCPPGERCATAQDTCIKTDCGDGVVQPGEACDDGNVKDGDGCSHDCTSDESCGNAVLDSKQGEVCDDGNKRSGDGCSADCHSTELCGNGYVDTVKGEACDDGNTVSGDGCSADCRSAEFCGNGYVDTAAGELCDDGNTVSGDGCSADCRSGENCGNHIRDDKEECDDGNSSVNDNCVRCKLARCGDGEVDLEQPDVEECDYAATPATCNYNCKVNACGDGIVNAAAGEECDLGDKSNPPVDHKTCNFDCTIAVCGDGYKNAVAGEKCDDGNNDDCGTCKQVCQSIVLLASGSITAIDASRITEGDSFTLSDGNRSQTFELTTITPPPTTTNVLVQLVSTDKAAHMATAIVAAIGTVSNLELDASVSPSNSAIVLITNKKLGLNNNPITKTVSSNGFKVSGMSGGDPSGFGCGSGVGCKRDQDCADGLQCSPAHQCMSSAPPAPRR